MQESNLWPCYFNGQRLDHLATKAQYCRTYNYGVMNQF